MQEFIIVIIFLAAIFYVSRKIYMDFNAKDGCQKGCGACSLSDSSFPKAETPKH